METINVQPMVSTVAELPKCEGASLTLSKEEIIQGILKFKDDPYFQSLLQPIFFYKEHPEYWNNRILKLETLEETEEYKDKIVKATTAEDRKEIAKERLRKKLEKKRNGMTEIAKETTTMSWE